MCPYLITGGRIFAAASALRAANIDGATNDAAADKGVRSVVSKKAGSFCPQEIDLHT
jgi:hypothetical protein